MMRLNHSMPLGRETERLQHVIDGLLRLARAEGEQQELVTVDLAEIATERFAIWQPLAEEQGIRLNSPRRPPR